MPGWWGSFNTPILAAAASLPLPAVRLNPVVPAPRAGASATIGVPAIQSSTAPSPPRAHSAADLFMPGASDGQTIILPGMYISSVAIIPEISVGVIPTPVPRMSASALMNIPVAEVQYNFSVLTGIMMAIATQLAPGLLVDIALIAVRQNSLGFAISPSVAAEVNNTVPAPVASSAGMRIPTVGINFPIATPLLASTAQMLAPLISLTPVLTTITAGGAYSFTMLSGYPLIDVILNGGGGGGGGGGFGGGGGGNGATAGGYATATLIRGTDISGTAISGQIGGGGSPGPSGGAGTNGGAGGATTAAGTGWAGIVAAGGSPNAYPYAGYGAPGSVNYNGFNYGGSGQGGQGGGSNFSGGVWGQTGGVGRAYFYSYTGLPLELPFAAG